MQGCRVQALLLGVALTWLGAGRARADVLSDLIAGHGSVQVGNLIFDQFSYSPTGQMPSSSNVTVTPTFDASGNPGIRIAGGFTDASNGTGAGAVQQASDAVLTYRVSSVGAALNNIHLLGNPQILGPGDGVMSVVESFQAGAQPVQLEIHDTVNNGVASLKLQDSATFTPVPSIQVVTKDIFAFNLGGVPTQSILDQTFTTAVPEPGTVLLMGLGVAGLAGYHYRGRRHRRRRAGDGPPG